jgi:acid phosphatase type 7
MKQTARSGNVSTRLFKLLVIMVLLVGLFWLPDAGLFAGHPSVVKAAGDPVIAAAGDIACDPTDVNFQGGNGTSANCRQKYTSDLLVNAGLAAVLSLGDNQYFCGGYQAFQQSYDLSWGRLKAITHPVVGNHEYLVAGGTGCSMANAGAAGYFQYFGAAAGNPGQGYYSYDIGAWHLIALNSNCTDAGGCAPTTPQGQWLEADLTAHPNSCILAYWHIPLFSSGGRQAQNSKTFWQALYNHHADLILNGHDHIYERFAPQNSAGVADAAQGVRQFTVGTGGADHTTITVVAANSELRNTDTYGVLMLTLHPTGYDWQFVPEAGKTFTDSGTQACHGSSAATLTPTNTSTPTSAFSPTPTNTLTPTNTPTPTSAFSPTPTNTSTPTNTPTPTSAFSPTPSNTPTDTPTPTATQSSNSVTFVPTADAYVDSSSPTTNFGTTTTLRADGSPIVLSFLKFSVSGLSGAPSQATLRLWANSTQTTGVSVHNVADTTWGEKTITYNNMPAYDTGVVGSSGPIKTAGAWYSINITSLISGNGTFSMAFTTTNSTAISFASRESGAHAPQLVITP